MLSLTASIYYLFVGLVKPETVIAYNKGRTFRIGDTIMGIDFGKQRNPSPVSTNF